MNLSNYLEKLYHKDIPYIKTNLGLTNTIYKARIDDVDVAIRVPNDDISNIINNDEKQILDLIKQTDLDVEEVYYDSSTHIRITKWVHGALNYTECKDINKNIKAIKLIKTLHNYKFKVNKIFDPYLIYQEFKKNINYPLFNYGNYEYLFNKFKQIKCEMVLCHNDLVAGNFLFTDSKEYLIDYEYAGMNNPLFDLMSFISENNIDDINIRKEIYKEYYQRELNDNDYYELFTIEMMMHLLWASWANMLYDSRKDNIYKEIYLDKIKHLKEGLKK